MHLVWELSRWGKVKSRVSFPGYSSGPSQSCADPGVGLGGVKELRVALSAPQEDICGAGLRQRTDGGLAGLPPSRGRTKLLSQHRWCDNLLLGEMGIEVSYCLYSKLPQIRGLTHNLSSYSSGGQLRKGFMGLKSRCKQSCIPSGSSRGESIPWPFEASRSCTVSLSPLSSKQATLG